MHAELDLVGRQLQYIPVVVLLKGTNLSGHCYADIKSQWLFRLFVLGAGDKKKLHHKTRSGTFKIEGDTN